MSTKSIDKLLDLLIDALEERKIVREDESADPFPQPVNEYRQPATPSIPDESVEPAISPVLVSSLVSNIKPIDHETTITDPDLFDPIGEPMSSVMTAEHEDSHASEESSVDESEPTEFVPTIDNMPRTMVRLFIALVAVIAFANLQLFDLTRLNALFANGNDGATSVRFARNGMLLQGDSLRVYLMEDNKRRWITTSEAFTAYGYRWGAVRHVGDDYLAQFEEGEPIYLAMKCPSSPHVFALDVRGESQRVRRWISDIETFEEMGFVWEEIDQNRCSFLRSLQDGQPFPVDVGERIPNP